MQRFNHSENAKDLTVSKASKNFITVKIPTNDFPGRLKNAEIRSWPTCQRLDRRLWKRRRLNLNHCKNAKTHHSENVKDRTVLKVSKNFITVKIPRTFLTCWKISESRSWPTCQRLGQKRLWKWQILNLNHCKKYQDSTTVKMSKTERYRKLQRIYHSKNSKDFLDLLEMSEIWSWPKCQRLDRRLWKWHWLDHCKNAKTQPQRKCQRPNVIESFNHLLNHSENSMKELCLQQKLCVTVTDTSPCI